MKNLSIGFGLGIAFAMSLVATVLDVMDEGFSAWPFVLLAVLSIGIIVEFVRTYRTESRSAGGGTAAHRVGPTEEQHSQ